MTRLAGLMRNTPFSRQLSIVVALAVLSIAFASSLATSWQGSRQIRADLQEQGRQITENLARQSKLALVYDAAENAREAVATTLDFPDVIALEIRRADGRLLLGRAAKGMPEPQHSEKSMLPRQQAYLESESDESWRFVAPVLAGGQQESPFEVAAPRQETLGYVRVVQSKATLARIRAQIFAVNFAVSFLFAFAFLFLVRRLTARITRPLDRLSAAMARAEAGASQVRAEPGGPRDIAEMALAFNKMMAVLEERERYLQTLLDNLPAAVLVHGPDAGIRYANPVARTLLGVAESAFDRAGFSTPSWHFIRADGSDMVPDEHPVRRVMADMQPLRDYTVGVVRAPGEPPQWVAVSAFPEIGEGGRLEQIIVCFVDITERKQYELVLEREAEEWTQAMDAFADAIYLLDMKRRLVRANKMFYALTGTEPAHVVGRHIAELIHPHGEQELCPVCRVQEERRDGVVTLEADHPDNPTGRPIEVTVKVIRDQTGEPHYLLASIHDLTNARKFEDELRLLNESLERRVQEEVARNREKDAMLIQQSRLATMGEMMHNVAHQWRQPLSALSLLFSNIKDDFDFGELSGETLDRQVSTGIKLAQKMSSTIDDFRDFFRPDHAVSRFSLKESVREALNLVEASFNNSQINVEVEAGEDIFVDGYANEFSQVLLNVLTNAKDAVSHRKGSGMVNIAVVGSDGMGEVRIRDNGGGIPEDALPKIFDPYFTTKESGTGIGLYMSRMIMGHMHGQIVARNVEGGAEIVISVPLAD